MGSFKNAADPDHSARAPKKTICPHCHKQIVRIPGGKKGRPYTAYLEANGERKHLNDWAAILGITAPAITYYLRKKKFTMQQVFDRLTDPNYKKPGPAQGHNWRKAAKEEHR